MDQYSVITQRLYIAYRNLFVGRMINTQYKQYNTACIIQLYKKTVTR